MVATAHVVGESSSMARSPTESATILEPSPDMGARGCARRLEPLSPHQHERTRDARRRNSLQPSRLEPRFREHAEMVETCVTDSGRVAEPHDLKVPK